MMATAKPLRINWTYIAFCAVVGAVVCLLIGSAITLQVYGDWSRGDPVRGGWNWPVVIAVDTLCVAMALAWIWKIYGWVKTEISAEGVSQPSLFGRKFIAWRDVEAVKVFGGLGWHIRAKDTTIILVAYAYRDPSAVLEIARLNINSTRENA